MEHRQALTNEEDAPSPVDEHSAAPREQVSRRRRSATTTALMILTAFLGGVLATGWLTSLGDLAGWLPGNAPIEEADTKSGLQTPTQNGRTPDYESRFSRLEDRLNIVALQAGVASGNVAHAEALLVTTASRRQIERGRPLGFLENLLQRYFGNTQPRAVATLIEFAHDPITLGVLDARLDAISRDQEGPILSTTGWSRIRAELGALFSLQRDEQTKTPPEARIARARMLLTTGNVDQAIAEIRRLPTTPDLEDWIADADRYRAVQQALDLIETTVLVEPVTSPAPDEANGQKPPATAISPDQL